MTIYAVGRNYAEHAKELGNNPSTEFPLVFCKPGAALVASGHNVVLPSFSKEVHYETEMAVQVFDSKPVRIAIALDLTARDVQTKLKSQGLPWELAKAFKGSCPIGSWHDLHHLRGQADLDLSDLWIEFLIDGELRQSGHTKDMIFGTQAIIDYLIQRFPLQDGDIVLTGTPAGVGPLSSGQNLHARLLSKDKKKALSEGHWKVN